MEWDIRILLDENVILLIDENGNILDDVEVEELSFVDDDTIIIYPQDLDNIFE